MSFRDILEQVLKRLAERGRKATDADYRRVFNTEAGKRVLDDLAAECKLGTGVYPQDPTKLAFWTGRQSLYMYILNRMQEKKR